ncbi:hypothetical protein MJO29_000043 [Puccinia striiformis f. sp. tritici]|uniref:Uncharacterized protein n=1 Tax=Puccinia striiformis f. sp. tritici PST-78 TaxID=1165861 RepID=A0A0L0UZQ7_9BASI|nr:hypothetical protein Pst134EA_000039 [Puccinia striiformis f. sp. tritici]KAH9472955.1 hypothetical protein Pst134EA_000039 [Puccinia striiformis f. sp. tritici]KAI7966766.1 hypothetical protein MJO29_000043 [Puccinia striiformis f. sp. tritici]KAI9601700.1 hypothetical protein H4Q26_001533 [Puccinia striiformis f. sp. tritici PST-130]KNE92421.1 hypothetical protein PSTG_14142 [Puccinia striiformis f. sp. tritici PST-78]
MHIRQMITILGLCLSQARALAIAPAGDEAIKSFVELVTQPDVALENTPGFSKIADNLQQKHNLDHDQFHQDLAKTVNPLLQGSEDHTPYILESFLGYRSTAQPEVLKDHPKLKAERLQIYRNSLYSELDDLSTNKPKHFNADSLQEAHNKLVNLLKTNAEGHPSDRSSSPEGILEEMQENFSKAATTKSHIQLSKYSREEINAKLKATNRPDVPDALLIDGKTFNSHLEEMLTSHSHHHSPSAGASPNAKPVEATA